MSIKAIDSSSIHRLTSGQVIIDLQTAVKELVENSLDASATSIEVRFRNYGLKSIEVIDNGHGIREEDYDNIALKHHTSKLSSHADLATVRTYGFRGEALSSLCALCSSFTVVTATAEQAPVGTILEFHKDGKLRTSRCKVARNKGTTTTVSELFTPLPVRRKEFERNVKREFAKALSILHAYALVPCTKENNGVRLVVTNQHDKGSRSTQLQTDGSSSLEAVVSSLWGPKSLVNVVPLRLAFTVAVDRFTAPRKRGSHQDIVSVEVQGLISKFSPGCGRMNTDRQFFFVNGRPCVLNKIQKVLNEIYRSFNAGQTPFVIADFRLPTEAYDVNVSPDKRSIFLHSEDALIRALQKSLEDTFSSSRSTYHINTTLPSSTSPTGTDRSLTVQGTMRLSSQTDPIRESLSSELECQVSDLTNEHTSLLPGPKNAPVDKQRQRHPIETLDSPVSSTASRKGASLAESPPVEENPDPPKKRLKLDTTREKDICVSNSSQLVLNTKGAAWNLRRSDNSNQAQLSRSKRAVHVSAIGTQPSEQSNTSPEGEDLNSSDTQKTKASVLDVLAGDDVLEDSHAPIEFLNIEERFDNDPQRQSIHAERPTERENQPDELGHGVGSDTYNTLHSTLNPISAQESLVPEVIRTAVNKGCLKLDLPRLRSIWQRLHSRAATQDDNSSKFLDLLERHAGINSDIKDAEEELTRVIDKKDFDYMRIIGQFNRGFVITRLRRRNVGVPRVDDLFIVDQHAADEKYNFESLQQSTSIKSQKLLRPQPIELTSAEELTVVDNLQVLRENGFDIVVREDAAPGSGNRIQLVSQPISKDTVFDMNDLTELLHLIQEKSGNQMVRCSKARAMFAMRACRKSVMIGMPLTTKQMITIVRNMGLMDQPWHCPHGRPTMRHLANLRSFNISMKRISWSVFALSDYLEYQ